MGGVDRRLWLAQAFLSGVALALLGLRSVPPHSYAKDLQQEYLAARALRDGLDVFAPITDLSARYFPVATDNFPHPNPHPPFLTLLSVPLTFLPFPTIVCLWLALSVVLLVVVGRWLGLSLRASLALAAWPPLWWLLYVGQLELAVLALAMLGWRAAAEGREWRAGVWLGLAAALKFYPALLLAPYVARRQLRVPLAAGLIFAASQVGSLAAVGPSGLVRYYHEVLPAVADRYVRQGLNSSPYGALLRLFGGSSDVEPLADAAGLVLPLTIVLSALALLALLRLEPELAPVAVLVAIPNAWGYYAVLALPAIVALLRRPGPRAPVLASAAAASLVLPVVNLMLPLFGSAQWGEGRVPAVVGVLGAIQPAGYVGLLLLSGALALPRRGKSGRREPVRPSATP